MLQRTKKGDGAFSLSACMTDWKHHHQSSYPVVVLFGYEFVREVRPTAGWPLRETTHCLEIRFGVVLFFVVVALLLQRLFFAGGLFLFQELQKLL